MKPGYTMNPQPGQFFEINQHGRLIIMLYKLRAISRTSALMYITIHRAK